MKLIFLLFLVAAAGCNTKPYGMAPEIGVKALINGGPESGIASLSELRGNVVLLDFWATWCHPCVQTIPHINKFVDRFQGRPVRFISVTEEDAATVRGFMGEHPIKSWIGLDPDHRVFQAFHVRALPRAVLIDPYGRILHVTDPRFISAGDIESALKAKPPEPVKKS